MPTVLELAHRQSIARDRLTAAVTARVGAAWSRFDAPYNASLVEELAGQLASIVRAGQVQIGAITDAYLAGVISVLTGRQVGPLGVEIPGQIRGVDPLDVYQRPAAEYRRLISEGVDPAEASRRAGIRLGGLANMDLGLSSRWAAREVMRQRGVASYRRVPMGAKPCGLCLAASTRDYHRENLLPLHGNCRCTVMPIAGSGDVGHPFTDEQLQDLYEKAGSTYGKDLRKVRYEIHQHGEYGPTLTVAGQRFRGPAEVARLAS